MSLSFDSARLPNPDLTEEHHAWRDQLRRFIDREIMPYVDEWDEQSFLPNELWGKAAEFGLLGLGYPEQYGGTETGIDLHHVNIVSEELKAEIVPPILAGEKRISLAIAEPSGGSGVANMQKLLLVGTTR
jgi:acyl-CoA dehydrogenase